MPTISAAAPFASGSLADGLPIFAVDHDLAARLVDGGQGRRGFAQHGSRPGFDGQELGAQPGADDKEEKGRRQDRGRNDQAERQLKGRLAVEEHERAEKKGDDAAAGQNAVGRRQIRQ